MYLYFRIVHSVRFRLAHSPGARCFSFDSLFGRERKKNNTHVAHKFMKLICAVYCKRETLQRRNNSNYSICNDRMQLGDGVFAFEAHASMINFNNNWLIKCNDQIHHLQIRITQTLQETAEEIIGKAHILLQSIQIQIIATWYGRKGPCQTH